MNNKNKLAFFLPNSFTALNLACGFASILFSIKGLYFEGAMVILLGSVFDAVDGRVARLTGTQSSFGEQFDSMSDLISFGLAPSLLVYLSHLQHFSRLGQVISFLFLLGTALRLARFNTNLTKVSSDYFQGLPSPAAALGIISIILFSEEYSINKKFDFIYLIYTAFYAILMITNIPFYSFKNSLFLKKHKKKSFLFIIILTLAIFTYYKLMLAVVINIYVITSIIYFLIKYKSFNSIFELDDEHE